MMSASLVPSFGQGETVASFASRTAAACGLESARQLGADLGFNFLRLASGHQPDVGLFAGLVGKTIDDLEGGIVCRTGSLHEIGGETVRLAAGNRLRICPHCIVEDKSTMSGRRAHRGYGRVAWLVGAVRSCDVHSTLLVTSEKSMGIGFTYDFAQNLKMEQSRMDEFLRLSVAATRDALDEYVSARIAGHANTDTWLAAIPIYVVVRLAECVGAIMRHGIQFVSKDIGELEWKECAHTGFQLVASGEEGFRDFIRGLHRTFFEGRGDFGGPSIYGRLYIMLTQAKADPGYDPIRRIMREEAIEALPLGPQDTFFTPVETRRWHSIETASNEFDVHPKRLRKLLAKGGLIDPDASILTNGRVLMEASEVAEFMAGHVSGLTASRARLYVNAPRVQFDTLAKQHFIKADIDPGNEAGMHPRFSTAELDRFLKKLEETRTVFDCPPELETIPMASRIARSKCRDVHDLLLLGRLNTVAIDPNGKGYLAIRVDPKEITEKTRLPDHRILTLRQVEKMLSAKTSVVAALIRAGHLKTLREINPINRNGQTVVDPAEVERFKSKFISLGQLAVLKRTAAWALKARIKDGSVQPVFDSAEIGVQYYRRSDLIV